MPDFGSSSPDERCIMLTTVPPADRQTIKLSISDMTCASCVRRVVKAIE